MQDNMIYLNKEGIDQEFVDKLRSLSLEEIYKLIAHNCDLHYVQGGGVVSGLFYWEYLNKPIIKHYEKEMNRRKNND